MRGRGDKGPGSSDQGRAALTWDGNCRHAPSGMNYDGFVQMTICPTPDRKSLSILLIEIYNIYCKTGFVNRVPIAEKRDTNPQIFNKNGQLPKADGLFDRPRLAYFRVPAIGLLSAFSGVFLAS